MLSCERTSSFLRALALRPASLSSARSVAITLAPSAMNVSAIARPMPCPAAVTNAVLPFSRSVIFASLRLCVESRQADFLPAVAVKIVRRQPALETGFARRPFAVGDGKPCSVAAMSLGDHVLAENSLEAKAKTQRGAPGRRVQCIAFPFVTPATQRFESITRQQV